MAFFYGLGKLWQVLTIGAMALLAIAGSYFLVIGGLFDLFSSHTLNSGIGWVDDQNRSFLLKHGGGLTGILKILVIEPLWVSACGITNFVVALPAAGLMVLGRR